MIKALVIDCESTIHAEGNPFSRSNKLCCVGTFDGLQYRYYDIEHSNRPYNRAIEYLSSQIDQAELIVNHNLKYDLHWLQRYGITLSLRHTIWDTQLAEYLLSDQRWIMPSLDDACNHNGLKGKDGSLSEKYWSRGIDTTDIPTSELLSYNRGDCKATWRLWQNQLKRIDPKRIPLYELHNEDLLVLQAMEYNGLLWNTSKCHEARLEAEKKLADVERELSSFDPHGLVKWSSDDNLSAVLYGGMVVYDVRETVEKHLKKGIKLVERWGHRTQEYPRLVEPLPGTDRKKKGFYFVNEDVLKSLKPTGRGKKLIELVLAQSDLAKLLNTYLVGIPKLMTEMDWPEGEVHGTINQSVTRTGRSSASKPNQQNFSQPVKELIVSRFV